MRKLKHSANEGGNIPHLLKFNQPFADGEQKAEFVIRPGF